MQKKFLYNVLLVLWISSSFVSSACAAALHDGLKNVPCHCCNDQKPGAAHSGSGNCGSENPLVSCNCNSTGQTPVFSNSAGSETPKHSVPVYIEPFILPSKPVRYVPDISTMVRNERPVHTFLCVRLI